MLIGPGKHIKDGFPADSYPVTAAFKPSVPPYRPCTVSSWHVPFLLNENGFQYQIYIIELFLSSIFILMFLRLPMAHNRLYMSFAIFLPDNNMPPNIGPMRRSTRTIDAPSKDP